MTFEVSGEVVRHITMKDGSRKFALAEASMEHTLDVPLDSSIPAVGAIVMCRGFISFNRFGPQFRCKEVVAVQEPI